MAAVHTSEYWEQRYQEGRTRWDLGGPTPIFAALLKAPKAQSMPGAHSTAGALAPGKVLVVGCGTGHDVLLLARHGFDALGVDFAPSAVEAGTAAAREAGLTLSARFEQANIFDLPARYPAHFDYILERGCYCAIDPSDRERYVEMASSLLTTGGRIVGQFFLGPQTKPGPPFATSVEELRDFFAPHFQVEHLGAPQSDGPLPGIDLLVILRRT